MCIISSGMDFFKRLVMSMLIIPFPIEMIKKESRSDKNGTTEVNLMMWIS